ncbi:MAG: hypothetical protein BGO95_05865 [Micrococcales bacterium 73-13]|nr:MAG: hypothetical protein BGO95_05865 [Micrococcales bacterium 73-13]
MADRTEDWNALFDPATETVELQRIAAERPEFAGQAAQHANWTGPAAAPVPPIPAHPTGPVAPVAAAPVYLVPPPPGARLSGGERGWWVIAAIVWLATYAVVTLLPLLGVVLVDGALNDDFFTRLIWVSLGFEAIPFVVAIIAALVTGRGGGRKAGAVVVLLVGLALLGLALWWTLGAQISLAFLAAFGAGADTQLLAAALTALPVAVEVAAGVIAYTIAGNRRWHTLWTIPIGFGLMFGAFFLGNLFATMFDAVPALILTTALGVLVRLVVVILAGAFGSRREPAEAYAAPVYAPPSY